MKNYQQTIEAFDKQAVAYQHFFMDLDLYNHTYDAFCELIPQANARIFEIGCGPGNITRYLLNKRPDLKIEATDAAPAMVTLAQTNNPTAACSLLDCRDLHKITGTYNGIVSGFCLPYLSREDCEKLIKDVADLLESGGIFYLSTLEGHYSNSGLESSSNGKYQAQVYYYQEDYLQKVLKANTLEAVQVFREQMPKADGSVGTHLIILARKT